MTNSKWRGTFNWWEEYPPGEVKQLKEEDLKGYQSTYSFQYGVLMERGWKRKDGRWISQDDKWSFDKIKEAYDCQVNYLDKIHDPHRF